MRAPLSCSGNEEDEDNYIDYDNDDDDDNEGSTVIFRISLGMLQHAEDDILKVGRYFV